MTAYRSQCSACRSGDGRQTSTALRSSWLIDPRVRGADRLPRSRSASRTRLGVSIGGSPRRLAARDDPGTLGAPRSTSRQLRDLHYTLNGIPALAIDFVTGDTSTVWTSAHRHRARSRCAPACWRNRRRHLRLRFDPGHRIQNDAVATCTWWTWRAAPACQATPRGATGTRC
jgi:hypothetical protein